MLDMRQEEALEAFESEVTKALAEFGGLVTGDQTVEAKQMLKDMFKSFVDERLKIWEAKHDQE